MKEQISVGVHIIQSHMDFSQVHQIAKAAENLGFNSVTLMDHLRPVSFTPPKKGNLLECWTTLSALAMQTSEIKLGSMVTCASFRNPALLAKMAAGVDHISQGRLKFGIGAGWSQPEFEEYGYSLSSSKERIEKLNEAVQIIKALWIHEEANFQGKYFRITEAACYPKPTQKPYPPIFIGGGGEKFTLRVVAQHADGWNTGGSLDQYSHKLEVLKHHCAEVGREFKDIQLSWLGWVIPSSNPKEIIKYIPDTTLKMDEVSNRHLFGDADHCIKKIQHILNLGVTDLELVFPDTFPIRKGVQEKPTFNAMQWFAERILPEIR